MYQLQLSGDWIINLLGICLFQEGTPEFVLLSRMHKDQSSLVGWETVINDDLPPFTILPEEELEDTSVSLRETLIRRNNFVEEMLIQSKGCQGSKEPTVTWDRERVGQIQL